MIIVESALAKKGDGTAWRIGIIGSCRIIDPMHKLTAAGEVFVTLYQPPVTHTTREALQALRLATGDFFVPSGFEPYVLDGETLSPDAYPLTVVESVDAWIVEISSREAFICNAVALNVNFLMRNLVQRFAKQLLSWYRHLSLGKYISEEMADSTINALEAAGAEIGAAERQIVTQVRREILNPAHMAIDLREMTARFPSGRWVVVGTISDPDDAGTVMRDRRVLNEELATITRDLKIGFVDPSMFVAVSGRREALAADGDDIYHYAADYLPHVGRVLLEAATGVSVEEQRRKAVWYEAYSSRIRRANEELVEFYRHRVDALGVDGSGLYEHYARWLDKGILLQPADTALARLVASLWSFDKYYVLRAGLGEIAVALGLAGLNTTAFEFNSGRRSASTAGIAHLEASGLLERERVRVAEDSLPGGSVQAGNRETILAICWHVIVGDVERDAAAIFESLRVADAILVNPKTFLRSSSGIPSWQETMERFHANGFERDSGWEKHVLFRKHS